MVRNLLGLAAVVVLVMSCAWAEPRERTAYRDLHVGASQTAAFGYVCGLWSENGNFNLFLQSETADRLVVTSICSVEQEAMAASRWTFVDGRRQHEYVQLHFRDGVLVRVSAMRRGLDP